MAWVTCPHCGFTQIPAAQCLKCKKSIERPTPAAGPSPRPVPAVLRRPVRPAPRFPRQYLLGPRGARAGRHHGRPRLGLPHVGATADLGPAPGDDARSPGRLDLTGRWQGKIATTIADSPARPALREIFVETDRRGQRGRRRRHPDRSGPRRSRRGVSHGPRRRPAGSGSSRPPSRLRPRGAALAIDFIPFAALDAPAGADLEGHRGPAPEPAGDHVPAARIARGRLSRPGRRQRDRDSSRTSTSRPPTPPRAGTDVLSRVIHPGPDSSLRGFRNLVWDLSGAADFVGLQPRGHDLGAGRRGDRIVAPPAVGPPASPAGLRPRRRSPPLLASFFIEMMPWRSASSRSSENDR